jgi:hypothetical protein
MDVPALTADVEGGKLPSNGGFTWTCQAGFSINATPSATTFLAPN